MATEARHVQLQTHCAGVWRAAQWLRDVAAREGAECVLKVRVGADGWIHPGSICLTLALSASGHDLAAQWFQAVSSP